jgi:outer membrane protein TolC
MYLKLLSLVFFLLFSSLTSAQVFTLQQAEKRAIDYYPIAKMKKNYREVADLNRSSISKIWYPQLNAGGQATYQSDVTKISIPNAPFVVEPLSKEQFKFNIDVNQMIYDGGYSKAQQEIASVNANVEEAKIEVELHRLRERIQQLYLGTIYLDQLIYQLSFVKNDLEQGIKKMNAQLEGGVVYRSSVDVLKAEILKTEQREIEFQASRATYIGALAILTDTILNNNVVLEKPMYSSGVEIGLMGLQSTLFGSQKTMVEKQADLIRSTKNPKANLFAQGGYGRPGLNMLKNEFDLYGIGGIRFNWSLSNFYTNKNEKKLLVISRQNILLQEETFNKNTKVQADQLEKEILKLKALIEKDETIVGLRKAIKEAATAQLEAGVITSNDFLREVNAEDVARQTLKAHEIQMLQAELQMNMLIGKPTKK